MNELALFAGAGGGILGGILSGFRTICAVEIEPYCRELLLRRQRDGMLPMFPIWDDIRTFDGKPFSGVVDVITGGFPCQDISVAGRGLGINGERSGLWIEMFRIICEVRPKYAFVENSPALTSRGLGRVLADLASIGFDAEWGVLGAHHVGAPHIRERLWILAHPRCEYGKKRDSKKVQKNTPKRESCLLHNKPGSEGQNPRNFWETEPKLDRMANGVPNFMDRLKALGNAQVPAVANLAFRILKKRLEQE